MPAMTEWKPPNSEKELPLENPSKQFQYRHYVNWEVDLRGWGIGYKDAVGSWKIQVEQGGLVVFEQEVQVTIQVFSLGVYGLVLFTWNFVKDLFVTTIVNGQTITEENPAWKFTLGGGKLSEQGNFIPGGGSDYSNAIAIIEGYFETTIYLSDFEVGAKQHVIFDNWGLGISRRPEWQWRFLDGGFGSASLFDPTSGMTFKAISEGGDTVAYSTRMLRYGGLFETQFTLYDEPAAYLNLFRIDPSIMCVADIGGLRLFETRDDGLSWLRPADYMADIKPLASAVSTDGGQIFIYGTATADNGDVWESDDLIYLVLEREGATWKSKKTGKILENSAGELPPTDKITGMDYVDGTLILNTTESAMLETWQSTNDMKSFDKANIS